MPNGKAEILVRANQAADRRPANQSVSDPKARCPADEGLPPVFIDAHMHIQSGGCAPLPPLRARMANIRLGRAAIDGLGKNFLVKLVATKKIGDVSPLPTDVIGDRVVKENSELSYLAFPAQASYVGICVVLTMDMDFCHIDGYEGLPIYFQEADGRRYYLNRKSGTASRSECKKIYVDWREDWPLDIEDKNRQIREVKRSPTLSEAQKHKRVEELTEERRRIINDMVAADYASDNPYIPMHEDPWGYQRWEEARRKYCAAEVQKIEKKLEASSTEDTGEAELDRFLQDLNTSLHETWKQQLRRTERVAVQNPFRLLPLYHYDPRRYVKEDRSAPYKQLVAQGGVYIGFKMYTSQGYMPSESTAAGARVAQITKEFFAKCAGQQIPVMAHCTPAGFYTHQREQYIDLASPDEQKAYTRPDRGKLGDTDRLRYFQEHFVHPEAWRPVLQANPSLRLCLAHFASDKELWQDDPAEFGKPALTRAQVLELYKRMDEHNHERVMMELPMLSGRSLLDATWAQKPFPGAAKPSMDGSKVIYGKGWIRSIVELSKNYKNFFTDISYLPTFEPLEGWTLFRERRRYWHVLAEILRRNPFMVDHIMFGTDWYMILLEPFQYMEWFKKTIDALKSAQKAAGGQFATWDLFHQFAVVNPIKFYRLHEISGKLKANLAAKIAARRDIDAAAAKKQLERAYQTLERLDEATLKRMESEVKKGPLNFSVTLGVK